MASKLTLLARYNYLLEKYPVTTKMWSSGVLFALGDIICQFVIEKKTFKKGYDPRRTFIMTAVGTVYTAPLLHMWYGRVTKIASFFTKGSKMTPAVSTLFDQTFFATYCIGSMLFLFEYLDKKDADKSLQNVKEKLWPAMLTNWKIWPLAMIINFTFIPPNYRVLFSNFVGLFWNIYLSWIQNNNQKQQEESQGVGGSYCLV